MSTSFLNVQPPIKFGLWCLLNAPTPTSSSNGWTTYFGWQLSGKANLWALGFLSSVWPPQCIPFGGRGMQDSMKTLRRIPTPLFELLFPWFVANYLAFQGLLILHPIGESSNNGHDLIRCLLKRSLKSSSVVVLYC